MVGTLRPLRAPRAQIAPSKAWDGPSQVLERAFSGAGMDPFRPGMGLLRSRMDLLKSEIGLLWSTSKIKKKLTQLLTL